jgi:hypothetical protein
MPTLRRYSDRDGFHLKDYLHGVGYCTWQIGPEGLAYLRERGVRTDRDRVTAAEREYLRAKGLIWRLGDGGVRTPPRTPEERALENLVAGLVRWASQGGARALAGVLYGQDRDECVRCFSAPFLGWLAGLDGDQGLAGLDGISWPDFEQMAAARLGRLADPLHQRLVERGDTLVFWQLARIVGRVAQHREASSVRPPSWETNYPVLYRLFALLDSVAGGSGPRMPRSGPRPREGLTLPPCIRWEVDFQQVVAVLPTQRLRPGESITWEVSGVPAPPPEVWPGQAGAQVEETRSPPLDPAHLYAVTITVQPGSHDKTHRFFLPIEDVPGVLFAADGALLSSEEGLVHPPGDYLALVPHAQTEALLGRKGVSLLERVEVGPSGWRGRGWRGYRLRLAPGAEFGPYQIQGTKDDATWQAEVPPAQAVDFVNSLPVWIDGWPRLRIRDPEIFAGAVVEVMREGLSGCGGTRLVLGVGTDGGVPLCPEADGYYLDLAAAPRLKGVYGTVRLACRLPALPDGTPLTTALVRCPSLQLGYVDDPATPDTARAVLARSPHPMMAGEDTRVTAGGQSEMVLCARRPVESPGVTLLLPEVQVELRIRIPAARARLLSPQAGVLPWQTLPVELDLAAVGLDDRLRVELLEEPELENGRLLCHLVGGLDENTGRPSGPPRTFDIELHRWRDRPDFRAGGTVQVRGARCWRDLARLSRAEAGPPETLQPVSSRDKLIVALGAAVGRADSAEALSLAVECQKRASAAGSPAGDRELLPVAAARAYLALGDLTQAEACLDGLRNRRDLPDCQVILATVELRQGRLLGPDELAQHRQALPEGLADSPEMALLLAEFSYHFAHCMGGRALGSWQDCWEQSGRARPLLSATPLPRRAERVDASLLRGIASLILAKVPDITDNSPETEQGAWLKCLEFGARYLRTPWLRPLRLMEVPFPPGDAPTVFRKTDVALVRLLLYQAVGDVVQSRQLLTELDRSLGEAFFATGLLRARQTRLEGGDAREGYRRVIEQARAAGPEDGLGFLLEVVAEERSVCTCRAAGETEASTT